MKHEINKTKKIINFFWKKLRIEEKQRNQLFFFNDHFLIMITKFQIFLLIKLNEMERSYF